MNQMVKDKKKKNNNNNSSNSLVFGRWPQTTTTTTQVIPWSLADGRSQKAKPPQTLFVIKFKDFKRMTS